MVTLIDPNADVIKDPAVQKIFKSLDGERTVVSIFISYIFEIKYGKTLLLKEKLPGLEYKCLLVYVFKNHFLRK